LPQDAANNAPAVIAKRIWVVLIGFTFIKTPKNRKGLMRY